MLLWAKGLPAHALISWACLFLLNVASTLSMLATPQLVSCLILQLMLTHLQQTHEAIEMTQHESILCSSPEIIFIVLNLKDRKTIAILKRCCKTVAHINSSAWQNTIIWTKGILTCLRKITYNFISPWLISTFGCTACLLLHTWQDRSALHSASQRTNKLISSCGGHCT